MFTMSCVTRRIAVSLTTAVAIAAAALALAPASAEAGKAKKMTRGAFASYTPAKPSTPPKPPSMGVEKKDTGRVIPGDVVEKKVEKLTDKIHWLSSLDEAKSLAQKQRKPIFWLQALGDLDGEC